MFTALCQYSLRTDAHPISMTSTIYLASSWVAKNLLTYPPNYSVSIALSPSPLSFFFTSMPFCTLTNKHQGVPSCSCISDGLQDSPPNLLEGFSLQLIAVPGQVHTWWWPLCDYSSVQARLPGSVALTLWTRNRVTVSKEVNEAAVCLTEPGQTSLGSDFGIEPKKEGILPHDPDLQCQL